MEVSMNQRSGWLLCCALAVIVIAAPAAQAARTATVFVGGKWATATFTENNAPNDVYNSALTYDQAIIDEAVKLLGEAKPGTVVRMALHSMDNEDKFEQALEAARNRGVVVGVVFGGTPANLSDWNTSPGNLTWFKACDAADGRGAGCLSSHYSSEMHAKFMLFEEIVRNGVSHKNLVWVSSANMTKGSGARPFNNAITVYEASSLHEKLKGVWADMFNSTTGSSDYYDPTSGKGYFTTPDFEPPTPADEDTWGYVSPDSDPAGDMWTGRLNDITPPTLNGGNPCEIYVMQTYLDPDGFRSSPIDKLVWLKERGCTITTIVNRNDTGDYAIGDASRKKLYCAGIPVRWAKVHDKMLITRSTTAGAHNRPQVMTGSHNMTKSALRYNDELLVRMYESDSLYNAYKGHYDDAYSTRAVPFTGSC
jgi:hypothetical protein